MKRFLVFPLLVCLVGCSNAHQGLTAPTATSPIAAPPTTVSVFSENTKRTTSVTVMADDPQPPSCAWRDLVVARHIAWGGSTNDIVTLANQHKVFIRDTEAGYELLDYPGPWCVL